MHAVRTRTAPGADPTLLHEKAADSELSFSIAASCLSSPALDTLTNEPCSPQFGQPPFSATSPAAGRVCPPQASRLGGASFDPSPPPPHASCRLPQHGSLWHGRAAAPHVHLVLRCVAPPLTPPGASAPCRRARHSADLEIRDSAASLGVFLFGYDQGASLL